MAVFFTGLFWLVSITGILALFTVGKRADDNTGLGGVMEELGTSRLK